MRTTLDLDDGLLAEAKALAAREPLTLTRPIEEGLALRLQRATGVAASTARPTLPVNAGRGGLTAAVADPRRNSARLDREHQLVGNAISDGWIAAAVLANRERLVTFDRDFVPLLPSRQLLLLEG